jgi:hypothetical protein
MPTERVVDIPIERLQFGLSPRAETVDQGHVAALVEVLGDLPPIVVHKTSMRVIDGVHRVLAARLAGRPTVRGVLFEGDEVAARIEAVRCNVAHGKPLTLAERQSAALGVLSTIPHWSDRRIAEVTGLSPKTVGRLRTRATVDSDQPRVRVGRDERARPVDTEQLRRRVAEAIEDDPTTSNREIARRTGASNSTVRDVRLRLEQGRDVTPTAGRITADETTRPSANSSVAADVARWFEQHCIVGEDWRKFVNAIPISRVYELADQCRQQSDAWREFALTLEDRARSRRRSSP